MVCNMEKGASTSMDKFTWKKKVGGSLINMLLLGLWVLHFLRNLESNQMNKETS